MANTSLFSSATASLPNATLRNEAGGPAYGFTPKHALAQLAATGTFHGTYYASAESQLDALIQLAGQVGDDAFLAKLAVYSRERALMKDMPAALVALLASRDPALFHRAFDRVIDNGRVLRTLFQMIRSGRFGKKSLASSVQRAFRRWLNSASVEKLLSASIGNDPSLRDILRLARPTPNDNARRALFGWLTDKEVARWAPATEADLPEQVQLLRAFRAAESDDEQVALLEKLRARWDLLADSAKGPKVWAALARTMGPQALRMNLNTLQRHGVFGEQLGILGRMLAAILPSNLAKSETMVDFVAARLADESEIRWAKQFPYQYFAAYMNAADDVPARIKIALHRAAEIACGNVPELPGPVVIGVDVSGSMTSPVTGERGGGTSKVRCVDVAALVAAALLRRNPDSLVVPFDTQVYSPRVDPSDSILSLAERLAKYGGGGTDCSLPLRFANTSAREKRLDGVILVSDNQSWIYSGQAYASGANGSTGVMTEWQQFVRNQQQLGNAAPKLICIDLQPYTTTQAAERRDILNVGGFSDAVFSVISAFLADDAGRFVAEVEAIEL